MTVRELIRELASMPQDAKVFIDCEEKLHVVSVAQGIRSNNVYFMADLYGDCEE